MLLKGKCSLTWLTNRTGVAPSAELSNDTLPTRAAPETWCTLLKGKSGLTLVLRQKWSDPGSGAKVVSYIDQASSSTDNIDREAAGQSDTGVVECL